MLVINKKQKTNYKTFVKQILYLNKQRYSDQSIRKILRQSYSKNVVPSKAVSCF